MSEWPVIVWPHVPTNQDRGSSWNYTLVHRPVEPEFVLPTTAGETFEATDNLGKLCVFRTIQDGPEVMYLNERTWVVWNDANVLSGCTGHRIVGEA